MKRKAKLSWLGVLGFLGWMFGNGTIFAMIIYLDYYIVKPPTSSLICTIAIMMTWLIIQLAIGVRLWSTNK